VPLLTQEPVLRVRDDRENRDEDADHDREAATPEQFDRFVLNQVDHQSTVSPPVISMNISSSVCTRGRAERTSMPFSISVRITGAASLSSMGRKIRSWFGVNGTLCCCSTAVARATSA